jgi:hypothetical protein
LSPPGGDCREEPATAGWRQEGGDKPRPHIGGDIALHYFASCASRPKQALIKLGPYIGGMAGLGLPPTLRAGLAGRGMPVFGRQKDEDAPA